MEGEKKTRIKRQFVTIIMDKVAAHLKGLEGAEVTKACLQLEADLKRIEELIDNAKKMSKKEKARLNKLKSYSADELRAALADLGEKA